MGLAAQVTLAGFAFALLVHSVTPARILLLPTPMGSHLPWMVHLGLNLVERGHEVDLLAPDMSPPKKYLKSKVNILLYHSNFSAEYEEGMQTKSHVLVDMALSGSQDPFTLLKYIYLTTDAMVTFVKALFLENKNILQKLQDRHYDMAVIDGAAFNYAYYVIPYKLGIPYVSITTGFNTAANGVPALPSFVPSQATTYTDQMTFMERVMNTMLPDVGSIRYFAPNYLVTELVPEKPYISLHELQVKSELFFHDIAPPMEYPRPSLPHVIMVQGLTIKTAKKLDDADQRNFLDGASDGFILFSLGTIIASAPQELSQRFLAAFKKIPQRVLWRYDGPQLDGVPKNVKLVSWFNQNDVLGHPKCKLFITHCGNNGQFESLYHGVPMLGLPLFADQIYNARRIEALGFGMSLQLSTMTAEDFHQAILNMTKDRKYKKKTEWASGILKDDPMTALDKVSYWIEHIIKFGSDHLRSPAVDMPWYQYWMIDIALFLFVMSTVTILLLTKALKFVIRSLAGSCRKAKVD